MSRQIMPKFDFKEMMNKTVNKKSITDEIPSEPSISLSINENNEEDFLSELDNDKFISKTVVEKQTKEQKKLQKEQEKEEAKLERQERKREKEMAKMEKLNKKQVPTTKSDEDALFSDTGGSILYGRDRLQVIAKIQQYKLLFPEIKALAKLKIKKNADLLELEQYLAECEAITETFSIDQFLTDSILQTIKLAELASTRTKYNINGLSEVLKKNPQFNSLSKQLYLKYKVFGKMPVEAQLMLIISTSTWICFQKNQKGESKITHTAASMNKPVNAADFDDSDNEGKI